MSFSRLGVQRFKGLEVDFPVTLIDEFNEKGKKRAAINLEPGTRNLWTQTDGMSNLWAIPMSIMVCGHFYLVNNEVWFLLRGGDVGNDP